MGSASVQGEGAVKQGRVTVYGRSILKPPLCDSDEAQMIVVRDGSGAPMTLMVRLAGDEWGLTTPDDKDWPALCIRYGLLKPPPADVIINGAH